jgi:N6-L-threonylcarbamoyladenine synthase
MQVDAIGAYTLIGETVDDAAGEAFDKTAKLLGLGYPGGPALSRLAESGDPTRFRLPRPMINSGDLEFSFSGLKTAVLTALKREEQNEKNSKDLARAFVDAVVEVLVAKCALAMQRTGLRQLVVAGGVGANRQLRAALDARKEFRTFYPEPALCTDNGAMIAFAAALRLQAGKPASTDPGFGVRPRWDLAAIS